MFVLFLSSLPVFFIDGFFEQKISFTTCLENCHVIDGNIQVDAPGILIPPPTNLSTSTYRYGKPEGGKVSSTKRLESDENISASTSSTLGERGALETLYGRQDGENVPGLRPEVVNRLRKKFAEEKPGQKEKREASSTLQDVLDTKRLIAAPGGGRDWKNLSPLASNSWINYIAAMWARVGHGPNQKKERSSPMEAGRAAGSLDSSENIDKDGHLGTVPEIKKRADPPPAPTLGQDDVDRHHARDAYDTFKKKDKGKRPKGWGNLCNAPNCKPGRRALENGKPKKSKPKKNDELPPPASVAPWGGWV
ncbi:MAG: hypothetical protein L6R40_000592 [Gallowayella cf. fulva]|nr:MAG: hypothetical protein L6R40_000592 [Xanthomendoza cf. fulva]